jgi:hypothetical protein
MDIIQEANKHGYRLDDKKLKQCQYCGKDFWAYKNSKTCSDVCTKKIRKIKSRGYSAKHYELYNQKIDKWTWAYYGFCVWLSQKEEATLRKMAEIVESMKVLPVGPIDRFDKALLDAGSNYEEPNEDYQDEDRWDEEEES